MTQDDFSTVNVKGGDRAREVERIRHHYRNHRDTLERLAAEAPTQHLADEYQRLVREIDGAMVRIDELEGRVPPTQPGTKPLLPSPMAAGPELQGDAPGENPLSRVAAIVAAGVVVLALIGWLIWRASSGRTPSTTVSETAAPAAGTAPATMEPVAAPPAPEALAIRPALADYGTVRKGTRATRQFEITNTTSDPVPITVARSRCRCLYYEYSDTVGPKAKESITVTIDGARAKAGPLRETIEVRSKKDGSVAASFEVAATVE